MEEKKLWCELCGSKGVRHKNGCSVLEPQVIAEPRSIKVLFKTEYSVYNEESLVRVYSEEVHGQGARELAREFAKKNNYLIK